MLLTITYKGKNTEDLGFLLHKNPHRPQSFKLSYGNAYVFYPEVSDESTTAALLLDMNPIDLARGKAGTSYGGLFDYVNDRPYVCSSFMSNAIARVFGTALSGKCDKREELAGTPLSLTAKLFCLPVYGNTELVNEIFEPLGYTVETQCKILDEDYPEWGNSRYIDLTVSGNVKLSELLNHLYVLIPVFDKNKHYFVSEDEIEKLLFHGKNWLNTHPAKNKIVSRYFSKRRSFINKALVRLDENEIPEEEETVSEPSAETEKKKNLNTLRLERVRDEVLKSGASSVIDMGCGECKLTSMLLLENQIRKITSADVCVSVLERAKQRLHYDRMNEHIKEKLTLIQASLTYRDERFSGFDCACAVEVIEHIDPARIPAFERTVFEFAKPKTVIITTPNKEYNDNYAIPENELRHSDHRFEWTREEFRSWMRHICAEFGYTAEINEIGSADDVHGAPTQIGVFTKCG